MWWIALVLHLPRGAHGGLLPPTCPSFFIASVCHLQHLQDDSLLTVISTQEWLAKLPTMEFDEEFHPPTLSHSLVGLSHASTRVRMAGGYAGERSGTGGGPTRGHGRLREITTQLPDPAHPRAGWSHRDHPRGTIDHLTCARNDFLALEALAAIRHSLALY